MRDFHGERRKLGDIKLMIMRFVQGLDEESLEELQLTSFVVCKFYFFSFNILGLFPSSMWFHVLVYV
jgi:hypothetical protein